MRKLEEGVDPDILEDQMGDFTDGTDSNTEEKESRSGVKATKTKPKKLTRDPQLYEFADFV